MKSRFLLLGAVGSVFFASGVAWASFASTTQTPPSPVDITAPTEMHYADQVFQSRADAQAFKDWTEIVYDHLINKSSGDAYWKESQKRWNTLRGVLCPGLKRFCALPDSFSTAEAQAQVIEKIKAPAVLLELQKHFESNIHGSSFTFEAVASPVIDFVLAGKSDSSVSEPLSIWGMTSRGLPVHEVEQTGIPSLEDYQSGQQGQQQDFLIQEDPALGSHLLINLDLIRKEAAKFAQSWKEAVTRVHQHPSMGKYPSVLYADEYMLFHFFKQNSETFQRLDWDLRTRLRQFMACGGPEAVAARATLARFNQERTNSDYAIEIYQHAAYELLRPLILRQAEYFALARTGRAGVDMKQQVWESLLDLQANLDPQWVLYLISKEVVVPQGSIFRQFVNSGASFRFFYEEIEAILDEGSYQGGKLYSKLSYTLQAPELWDPDFLKDEAPEALQALRDPETGKARDIFQLTESEQKHIFHLYLFGSDTTPRVQPFYRMLVSLMERISPKDSAWLARYVHDKRAAEFKTGSSAESSGGS